MGWSFRMTILEKEDWKGVVDIVTNAKLVVSSIQDVAHKLADYASISSTNTSKLKCFYNFIKKNSTREPFCTNAGCPYLFITT